MSLGGLVDLFNSGTPPRQDYILLNQQKSPGRATVTGAGSPRTWDKQKGWGFSGATMVYTGEDLSDFDVLIDLWEPEHWVDWASFAKLLQKAPVGTRAKAMDIGHPLLNRPPLSITQVVIRDVTQWEQSPKGLWSARVMFSSFRSPKPALGKPDGTIANANNPISDFTDDPQIGALMRKQAALGGAL